MGRFVIDEVESEKARLIEIAQAKDRLRTQLLIVNLAVVGGGSYLCYVFAKRTLQPVEESARAQERFTSDASHELRTPLSVMRSEIEVALRDKALSKADAIELLKSNLEEVETMQIMTSNLLQLARQKEVGEKKTVDMFKVLKPIADKYKKLLIKENRELIFAPQNVKVYVNKESIRQAVGILLENSYKHAGDKANVTLSVEKKESSVLILVSDTGKGIPSESMNFIFERFYKADESRTKHHGGASHGLGLSIAKQLIESQGGSISVRNIKKSGVEFRIELPLVVL
jgi:two-component system sensor histidine kinase CiaH